MPNDLNKPEFTLDEMLASSGNIYDGVDAANESDFDRPQKNAPGKPIPKAPHERSAVETIMEDYPVKKEKKLFGLFSKGSKEKEKTGEMKTKLDSQINANNPPEEKAPTVKRETLVVSEAPKEKPKIRFTMEPVIDDDDTETAILDDPLGLKKNSAPRFQLKRLSTGETYSVLGDTLVGCRDGCDLYIPQAKEKHNVSRTHAYLIIKNDKLYVKDESTNGTFIGYPETPENEFYRVPKDTEMELKDGQIVRFADIKFQVIYFA